MNSKHEFTIIPDSFLQSLKGLKLEYTETDLLVLKNVGKVTTQQTIAQDVKRTAKMGS